MPPAYSPYQDSNGPLLRGDPLLDRPGPGGPGWLFGAELDILAPHIKNHLSQSVSFDGFTPDTVHLPTAPLDWAGVPKFELGYRFDEGWGAFLLSYRFLITEGTAILPGFDLDGSDVPLRSRLNMNVVDLDYVSRELNIGSRWEMQWRVGVRLANVFFDSQAEGYFLEQKTSNYFFGAGPHAGLDLVRPLDFGGLSLFGRLELAAPIGQVHQAFEEAFVAQDGSIVGGATDVRSTQAVPTLGLQLGLSWAPRWRNHLCCYTFGYTFEEWWNLGDVAGSSASLTTQGFFFRGEFNF
jgi:major outer membrane protein